MTSKPTMNPTSSPTPQPTSSPTQVVPNPNPAPTPVSGQCSDGTGTTCSTMDDCGCSGQRKLLKGEAKQLGGRRNTQQYLRRLPKTWPTPPPTPPPVSPTNPVCLSSNHVLMSFQCTYKFLMWSTLLSFAHLAHNQATHIHANSVTYGF